MGENNNHNLSEVKSYYTERIRAFGETPQGVDWNGAEGQFLRFAQFKGLWGDLKRFSVFDLGCGYGALNTFLHAEGVGVEYLGVDIAEDMIAAAVRLNSTNENTRFLVGAVPDQACDYGVASGIFNVKLNQSDDVWRDYVCETLDVMNAFAKRGFAFNCLTSYSDPARMAARLFYAEPTWIFDWCKRKYSKNVALLHDYGLFEFTILVRKDV
jgi:SAM-dependent methyltransferase